MVDLKKLEEKMAALLDDPNFVNDFQQWIEARKPESEELKGEQFDCYEIWRPNIPNDGCKTQCKECEEKQNHSKIKTNES